MELRCPNCQQPVMAGDGVCWQCGEKLAQTESAGNSATAAIPKSFNWQIPPLYLYTLFTATLFLLALFLMGQLSQTPLVQLQTVWLPASWHHVTNSELTLTLDLPQSWKWFDSNNPLHQSVFEGLPPTMLENGYPLLTSPQTAKPLFLAAPTESWADAPVILVAIETPSLDSLSPAQALKRVEQSDAKIVVGEVVENFDKSHTLFLLDVTTPSENQIRCRQQFLPANDQFSAWLVTICGESAQFPAYDREIVTILQSFQRLQP